MINTDQEQEQGIVGRNDNDDNIIHPGIESNPEDNSSDNNSDATGDRTLDTVYTGEADQQLVVPNNEEQEIREREQGVINIGEDP